MESLIERLRKRAAIRRQIPTRKSVQEGQPDRIADLLEEAACALELSVPMETADEYLLRCAREGSLPLANVVARKRAAERRAHESDRPNLGAAIALHELRTKSEPEIVGNGGGDVPQEVRDKVCEVIYKMEQLGIETNNGSTALYWHLLSTIDSHLKK